ncbi:MAG: NAD-dependent epimerase/dehydratase family protein [Myxococcales bacterium]|nr:NAD-dependent epimerase/dehydratase family protein [Myxococcales bacterium]
MKRALVIGGTGFVGMNLVDALLERGHEVAVTYRKKSITVFVSKRDVELLPGDLDDPESLVAAMRGKDVVFLSGGHYPRYSLDRRGAIDAGVRGVRNACRAALEAGVGRLVYTSSIATLERLGDERLATEDDIPAAAPAESVYRATKWTMERELEFAREAGLDVVCVLPGGCVGPWDARMGTGGLLVGTVRAALPWMVDGLVNVVDVRDVARAHLRAAQLERPAQRYNVAGHILPLSELLERIVARYGGSLPPERLDAEQARARAEAEERAAAPQRGRVPMPRELVDIITWSQPVSSARALEDLDLEFTPLDDALDGAHAWFERFRYLPKTSAQPRRTP